ncbi:MAG: type II toxin-antitoxin system CcdA family antitoxin [Actinobacteria bacterium]|jgi:Post-segregation antitoxin CcdA.|nr:type II toxin-antitoxin system CcdA family antitoxin [Actinomycetota bacterium]
MARVNVSIPDEVIERARAAKLNVSALATSALEEALERQVKIEMAKDYLAELEAELGPISESERAEAVAILDRVS